MGSITAQWGEGEGDGWVVGTDLRLVSSQALRQLLQLAGPEEGVPLRSAGLEAHHLLLQPLGAGGRVVRHRLFVLLVAPGRWAGRCRQCQKDQTGHEEDEEELSDGWKIKSKAQGVKGVSKEG